MKGWTFLLALLSSVVAVWSANTGNWPAAAIAATAAIGWSLFRVALGRPDARPATFCARGIVGQRLDEQEEGSARLEDMLRCLNRSGRFPDTLERALGDCKGERGTIRVDTRRNYWGETQAFEVEWRVLGMSAVTGRPAAYGFRCAALGEHEFTGATISDLRREAVPPGGSNRR